MRAFRTAQHLAPHVESDVPSREGYMPHRFCPLDLLNLCSSPGSSGRGDSVDVNWLFWGLNLGIKRNRDRTRLKMGESVAESEAGQQELNNKNKGISHCLA